MNYYKSRSNELLSLSLSGRRTGTGAYRFWSLGFFFFFFWVVWK